MISTHEIPRREAVFVWLTSLEEELPMLEQLAEVAAEARTASPEEGGPEGLHALLELQTDLCSRLEAHRHNREKMLSEGGIRKEDLLVAVLGALPKDEHPSAVDAFSRYIDAAEAAQRQIDINREFFSVALATLEDTLESVVSGVCSTDFYDASGSSMGPNTALCVSTVT